MPSQARAAPAAAQGPQLAQAGGRAAGLDVLRAALGRLQSQCGTQRRHAHVRDACAAAVGALQAGPPPAGGQDAAQLASLCFVPLRFACEGQSTRLAECALDGIQKLMAHGLVGRDTLWVPPSAKAQWAQEAKRWGSTEREGRLLAHQMVLAVCNAASCDTTAAQSEAVQLQALKALLHAVTTPTVGATGATLIQAVRGVYNIYLVSPSRVNQAAAKGALNQMVGVVLQRMEAASQGTAAGGPAVALSSDRHSGDHGSCGAPSQLDSGLSTPRAWLRSVIITAADAAVDAASSAAAPPEPAAAPPTLPAGAGGAPRSDAFDFAKAAVQAQQQHAAAALCHTESSKHAAASRSVGEVTSGIAIDPDDSVSPPAAAAAAPAAAPQQAGRRQEQAQRDALAVFRSFCKLAAKSVPGGVPAESVDMRNKRLSMELLHDLLSTSVDLFRNSPRFVEEVRQALCMSLLENCLSPAPSIFRLALELFLALLASMRQQLKREVGVFFTTVFFVLLDSPNATALQKTVIVQAFLRICQDPQTVTDIFVNYDCDIESFNVFETMVNALGRLAQARLRAEDGEQGVQLRLAALRALAALARSIASWANRFSEPHQQPGGSFITAAGANRGRCSGDEEHAASSGPLRYTSGDSALGGPTPSESSAAPSVTTPCIGALEVVDEFDRCRALKKELEGHVALFNSKGKEGLESIMQSGHLERNPVAVAKWLRNTPGIDKKQVGEYLARTKPFERSVLDAFVETFDFTGMEIDEAVRRFLSTFHICGEAQVIDRTMEKFAEQYTKGNEQILPNAGTAYALAFSIIMLNTDAHSGSIKDKMSKEEFLRNNRGLDDGKDLSPALLRDIYDRVTGCPFALEGEAMSPAGRAAEASRNPGRRIADSLAQYAGHGREASYQREMRDAMRKAARNFTASPPPTGGTRYWVANKLAHAQGMFEAAWAAVLSAVSTRLEQGTPPEAVDLCIDAFRDCIHVGCVLQMDTVRDAFVTALAKLTFLSSTREIEERHLRSVQLLIDIALAEGNYLRSSWREVLSSISRLERLHLIACAKPDAAGLQRSPFGGDAEPNTVSPSRLRSPGGGPRRGHRPSLSDPRPSNAARPADAIRQNEVFNAQLVAEAIDDTKLGRVYGSTQGLTDDAAVCFVKHLCEVSVEEVECCDPPRVFSLQKIVEVADDNMDRMRFVWTQIWKHLSAHFVRVGTNPCPAVSMLGVDSLRQLAVKFLAKPELTHYHFQRDFLKPFEIIAQRSESVEIRELVVTCIDQVVAGSAPLVKSGWKAIFGVFAIAAADADERIVGLAFQTADRTARAYLPLVVAADAFADAVNSFIAFACNRLILATAVAAARHLELLADVLVNGVEEQPGGQRRYVEPAQLPGAMVSTEDRGVLRGWLPILTGLCSAAAQQQHGEVRLAAVGALFSVLHRHGTRLTAGMWRLTLSVAILPIFDSAFGDLTAPGGSPRSASVPGGQGRAGAARSIIEQGLASVVLLFRTFFPQLRDLLGDFLDLASHCILRASGALTARAGVGALGGLLQGRTEGSAGEPFPFSAAEWELAAQKVAQLAASLFPSELLDAQWDGMVVVPAASQLTPRPGSATPPRTPRQLQADCQLAAITWTRRLRTLAAVLCQLHSWLAQEPGVVMAPRDALLELLGCLSTVHRQACRAAEGPGAATALRRDGADPATVRRLATPDSPESETASSAAASLAGTELLAALADLEGTAQRCSLLALRATWTHARAAGEPTPTHADELTDLLLDKAEAALRAAPARQGFPSCGPASKLYHQSAAAAIALHCVTDVSCALSAEGLAPLRRFAPLALPLVDADSLPAATAAARRFFAQVSAATLGLDCIDVEEAPNDIMVVTLDVPQPVCPPAPAQQQQQQQQQPPAAARVKSAAPPGAAAAAGRGQR